MSFDEKFEEFKTLWNNKADDIQNLEEGLTKGSSRMIYNQFKNSADFLISASSREILDPSRSGKNRDALIEIKSIESRLVASLAIAESNYRARHKTILERLIDKIPWFRSLINIGK